MKIALFLCLALAGASLAFPQKNDNEYELTNDIYDREYTSSDLSPAKPQSISALSMPLYIYKQVMEMKPSDFGSIDTLMKIIIAPIIKSAEFQVLTEFVTETLRLFKEDPQIKAMVRQGIDSIQGIYENSDGKLAKYFLTWMVSQYSDEETARSVSSLVSDVSPTLQSWFVEPLRHYYRSYITPTFSSIAHAMAGFFGEDLANNEIARSGRWSNVVDLYLDRLVDMTTEARNIMIETAKFLQVQDA